MAVQDPGIDVGYCVSGFDARNSSITGTTQGGPNGSAQFLAVRLSTSANFTIVQSTVAGQKIFGILQNKPSSGIAADVRTIGVSKVVAGSSAIAPGMELEADADGQLIPFSSAAGVYPVGRALESGAAVGQVISAWIYGTGGSGLAG